MMSFNCPMKEVLLMPLRVLVGVFNFFAFLMLVFISCVFILLIFCIAAITPIPALRYKLRYFHRMVIPEVWGRLNTLLMRYGAGFKLKVVGEGALSKKKWYFVMSNHQSWLDIFTVYAILDHKAPGLKFFFKKQLVWIIPIIMHACWANGYPILGRYTKSQIKKNKALKGRDMQVIERACVRCKQFPSTIIGFLEGTRFTQEKHDAQKSPYPNLLKPRYTGITKTIQALEGYVDEIIDVTIVYHHPTPTFWHFITRQVHSATAHYRVVKIPDAVRGNYAEDLVLRKAFMTWLAALWQEKSALIDEIKRREG